MARHRGSSTSGDQSIEPWLCVPTPSGFRLHRKLITRIIHPDTFSAPFLPPESGAGARLAQRVHLNGTTNLSKCHSVPGLFSVICHMSHMTDDRNMS